jgi:hypothetical protein
MVDRNQRGQRTAGEDASMQTLGRDDSARQAAALRAGLVYFALVFALGFLLGTVRTIFVADAPGAGRLLGVLLELPVMLVASWFICRAVLRRIDLGAGFSARVIMGAVAFTLLIAAEMLVGVILFGRSPIQHFALYREASYALGLAAQLAFALIPAWQLHRQLRRVSPAHP